MAEHNELGQYGESVARSWLKKHDYVLLEQNWHLHHLELDIIAEKEDWLVVVEVKTRTFTYLMPPEEAVDRKKARRMAEAGDAYARQKGIDLPIRFDVISIVVQPGKPDVIEHIEDAFLATEY
ncbi:MAG: YraN family protein [Massilibacteroides sp.]|nr:YraN family protein [Massilibacteroides sp.]